MGFKGKKVAVVGAGVEGISTVQYLLKAGANPILLDKKASPLLSRFTEEKIKDLGVGTVFGADYLNSVGDFDLIFRSPGVRPDLLKLREAEKKGSQITSQTRLFFDLCPAPIIGVTGTKGKGTTATLIYEILNAAGKRSFLGGNIGKPPLDFIDQVTSDSIVVLELSSFQLINLHKSPHISVVLMVTREHLDWHKDKDEYLRAKTTIVKYQTKDDFVVMSADYPDSKEMGESSKAKKTYFSTKKPVEKGSYIDKDSVISVTNGWTSLVKKSDIQILGEHNLQNVAAAVATAGLLEISLDTITQSINSFKGLPHRLEFVEEIRGVKFYNDSASTTPETAVAAIASFENTKVLILGGASKHSDFFQLGQAIVNSNVKAVILLGDEADKIRESINSAGKFSGIIIQGLDSMEKIVQKARKISSSGDVVLLSPACASFDLFENYLDRGDQFKKAVRNLN